MTRFVRSVFLAAAAVATAAAGLPAESPLTRGENPVFSPDGTRIAFQRLEGDVFKIGVVSVSDGEVEWIEEGPGNAAYPAWTPDGALVYMFGHDSETAREAWKGGSQNGYGLRIREPDGTKRDLTRGRCRDYAPCVSPDGATVYFVTTRGVKSESASFSQAAATRLAALDLASLREGSGPGEAGGSAPCAAIAAPRILLDAPNGNNSGYVRPAVSPDGSLLVWGQLDSFFDAWRLCGMRLGDLPDGGERPPVARITPSSLTALSPRWHPDGRTICFTGFRAGDDGWGVWVEDVRTGMAKRLCAGENPCFSPDGTRLAYDRGGTVFVRPFGPENAPDARLPDLREEDAPEATLWSTNGLASEAAADIAGDGRFAFGDDAVFFVRAAVRFDGGTGVRQVVAGEYAEHPRAFQLYASGGEAWFVSRDHAGRFFAAKAPLPSGRGDVSLVAVRTPSRLLLSVNGAPPRVAFTGGALPLDTPRRLVLGAGLADGAEIRSLEIGAGWPAEMPRPPTRESLFRSFADSLAPSPDARVARALSPWVESGRLPGAVSILCDGDRVETSCIGYADVAARRPVTLDDAFMQCSQTKGFCGVTAAILVEEGRLSLDDPVAKHLPEFATLWVLEGETNGVRTLRRAQNELTLRMCLNHTGGFPFEIPAKQPGIPGGGWTGGMPLRSVAATAAAQPLLFEPGTRTQYSNTGVDVAAAVVQTVAGMPWDRFLKERVLDPLGMSETRFMPTKAQIDGRIGLYKVPDEGPAQRIDYHGWEQPPYDGDHVFPSAGAGLWTTARDQVKFYRMLMNGGVGDNGARILREETVRDILATSSRPAGSGGYSLGFNAPESGRGWFGHGGAWGTSCQVDPDRRRLKLWVVQVCGTNRPWEKDRAAAEDAFFAESIDRTDEDAYTGRTE